MPDLLLELRSEEIPARMQRKAAGDLKKMITDGLVEAGLTYEAAREYWTPRRLALDVRGVTARSRDTSEEIKGPSTKAPEAALQGFLRKAGLQSVADAHVHSDPKKGDFYVAHTMRPGRAAEEIVAALVPEIIRAFPWPKSMRWGPASAKPGSLRWVRPLQSILCTFGPETEEPIVVDFAVDGIRSGNLTWGHRFHAPDPIRVRRFDDYVASLERAKVVLDAERRKAIILDDARNLAFANGLELVEDDGLLEEVSGLVEWPVVLMGEFPADFLAIPPEVIRLTIRANQKCFVTRVGEGALAPRFLLTANIEAHDGGVEIAHGNGKVVRARLSDALYFWKTDQADLPDLDLLKSSAEKFGLDLAKPLDQRMARLDHLGVTFHAKLGAQGERVERIRRLARELAPVVGADPELADRAAVLAKADLTTEIVGEFPELQGAMGRKYALLQGEHPSVAAAIEEHYKPQGPSDRVPTDPVSIAVALADKLDTLVGFWAIDEKPTGSKDPYALRRAALGVIRIVVENGVRLGAVSAAKTSQVTHKMTSVRKILERPFIDIEILYPVQINGEKQLRPFNFPMIPGDPYEWVLESARENGFFVTGFTIGLTRSFGVTKVQPWGVPNPADEAVAPENTEYFDVPPMDENLAPDLLSFLHDRLKVYLRDKGARHDLIEAVLAGSGSGMISPLEGEMGGSPEGGAVPPTSPVADIDRQTRRSMLPASALPGIFPSRGEITQPSASQPSSNDDLLAIVRRVEALGLFLATDDGRNLLAGAKRAANILAAEEKKGTAIAAAVDPDLFRDPAEARLHSAVNEAENRAGEAIHLEDYSGAFAALSALREPVDSFFEAVLVNDEDLAIRANRLALLARIRAATGRVADFSRIAG